MPYTPTARHSGGPDDVEVLSDAKAPLGLHVRHVLAAPRTELLQLQPLALVHPMLGGVEGRGPRVGDSGVYGV